VTSVSAADVRDVINISDTNIGDDKITKFIKRAEPTLEGELGS
jgi:hypothetical protein